MNESRWAIRICAYLLVALGSGCSSIYVTDNQPIYEVDETSGYRSFDTSRIFTTGDTTVFLAFSGGGTRAAALSYGVMQELRDTMVESNGQSIRLLDEVDRISSVSGGSFIAAYYGLYGDKLFDTFEDDFLRRNVQKSLIRGMLNPVNWIKGAFTAFDRKEMVINYYDQTIFKGATFADIDIENGPFIEINATDLSNGLGFAFNQERFDLICSDLSSYSVARAVTASSAVPVAFPTVVLENHADECDISESKTWHIANTFLSEGKVQDARQAGLRSYRESERRKYIHLVDGGISDNLGLRVVIDRIEGLGGVRLTASTEKPLKNIVFILVDAYVDSESTMEQTPKSPSASATMKAFTSAQIKRISQDTIDDFHQKVRDFNEQFKANGDPTTVYFSQVSFGEVENVALNEMLNNLPTSLELEDDEIDQLITAGRILLRKEPSYVRFLERNGGQRVENAISGREICNYFSLKECAE